MKGDVVNNIPILSYPSIDQSKFTGQFSDKQIISFIKSHQKFIDKFNENIAFYMGNNKPRQYNLDVNAPNNSINVPYARTMTKTIKGYAFKPGNVYYSLEDGKENEYFDKILDVYKFIHDDLIVAELGESQSKYGIGFGLLYVKQNEIGESVPATYICDPREIIPIFDRTFDKDLIACIRYFDIEIENDSNNKKKFIEVYYKDHSDQYEYTENVNQEIKLVLVQENIPNFFFDVPLCMYINNEEYMADYECVKSLIELYDKMITDMANEQDRFAAAYLIMQNYVLGGNAEESKQKVERLKELRVFEIDKDGDVRFLTKDIPVAFFQEIKVMLREDITYHSGIPDFRDQAFGTASGIAIQYKLLNLENLCADKESYFKRGKERELKLINNYFGFKDNIDFSYKEIKINFYRNLPQNVIEAIDNFKKVDPDGGKLSKQTSLSLLPFVSDIDAEMDMIKKEKEENESQFDIDNMDNENMNNLIPKEEKKVEDNINTENEVEENVTENNK